MHTTNCTHLKKINKFKSDLFALLNVFMHVCNTNLKDCQIIA